MTTLPHRAVTTQVFLTEYEARNRPLLVTGAAADWPALRGANRWTPAYLRRVAAGATFRATSGAAPLSATFALGDYFRYCASAAEEAPLYLFDRTFAEQCPQLLANFEPALREGCPWCPVASALISGGVTCGQSKGEQIHRRPSDHQYW